MEVLRPISKIFHKLPNFGNIFNRGMLPENHRQRAGLAAVLD
jgi:hypothetical protein